MTDLHVVVSVEGLAANWARELGGTNEDLRRCWYPVLTFVQPSSYERWRRRRRMRMRRTLFRVFGH